MIGSCRPNYYPEDKHMRLIIIVMLAIVAFTGCSKKASEQMDDEEKSSREVDPKYLALARKFGDAFITKDYAAGYYLMSDAFQQQVE
jgi:hypothetical protein